MQLALTYLDPDTAWAWNPGTIDHAHVWMVACRKDQDGYRVLDCSCGDRRFQKCTAAAGYVDVDVPNRPLFDATNMSIPVALMAGA